VVPPRPIVPPPGPLAPLFSAPRPNPMPSPLPIPRRPVKPSPDLSRSTLPASIRDSLAKLAGDPADEGQPAPPPPPETRKR
jgi:hypothetical protein